MADEDTPEHVEATAPAALATVSVKLPPFWPSDPEVWFVQVEAYFTTRRITAQRTHFDHVVASLSRSRYRDTGSNTEASCRSALQGSLGTTYQAHCCI